MTRSVIEWVAKNDDTRIPPRVRLRVFAAKGQKCHRCRRQVHAQDRWTCEHMIALVNGGANRESNLDVTCGWCLNAKNKEDVAEKSKVVTIRKKHLGIKTAKRPFPKRHDPWGKEWRDDRKLKTEFDG